MRRLTSAGATPAAGGCPAPRRHGAERWPGSKLSCRIRFPTPGHRHDATEPADPARRRSRVPRRLEGLGCTTKPTREQHRGSGRNPGAAGGRRALRPPDAPLEPQDAPLHLRRARRHLHHRPAEDRGPARAGPALRGRGRQPRRHRAVRGHQEAGARLREGDRRGGRPAVRQPPLARWPADQLPDDLAADPPPARPRALRVRGPALAAADARAAVRGGRPGEAPGQPRRRQEHAAAARRDVRRRPQDRGHRRP